jgi:hypothetical protein
LSDGTDFLPSDDKVPYVIKKHDYTITIKTPENRKKERRKDLRRNLKQSVIISSRRGFKMRLTGIGAHMRTEVQTGPRISDEASSPTLHPLMKVWINVTGYSKKISDAPDYAPIRVII